MPRPPFSITSRSLLAALTLAALLLHAPAQAQRGIPDPGKPQQRLSTARDTATLDVGEFALPDTIRIYRTDPRFPVRSVPVPDSALGLAYVRYDPVQAFGPDYVYLNSTAQPAALQPVLGTAYRRTRQLTQAVHPAYAARPAPFFEQNVPYTYTAYDQGSDINDGQVQVLLGRSFVDGWRIGAAYRRTYQGGDRNRYPESRAQRISFGITLAHVADSSHHRSYAWVDLNNHTFSNPGGYSFQLDTAELGIEEPFEATPLNVGVRTATKFSSYHVLHRYFLREQRDSVARGWAGAAELSYAQGFYRTSAGGAGAAVDVGQFAPYLVDDRGLRFQTESRTVLGEAQVGYFAAAGDSSQFAFSFEAGVYGGRQNFRAGYLPDDSEELLAGVAGELSGTVLRDFTLEAEADLPLGTRAGEGRAEGSLSWRYRERFGVEVGALLERSRAPFAAERVGVNDQLLFSRDAPIATHTRLSGALTYAPWSVRVAGRLDVYADAHVYDAFGVVRESGAEVLVPSLSFEVPLRFGPVRFDSRGVIRTAVQTDELRLPAYAGQHSLYYATDVFKRALQLLVGVDGRVVSPTRLYGYAPLTGAFTPAVPSARRELRYAADAFVAVKVQSFKAFLRVDNLLVSDADRLPASVLGYPVTRGATLFGTPGLLRFGVAFFLFN